MVAVRATVTVTAFDLAALSTTAPAFARRVRDLRFVPDGVIDPGSGRVRQGLRDLTGTHPRPGTRYLAVVARTAGDSVLVDETIAELLADDADRLAIRLVGGGPQAFASDIAIEGPEQPRGVIIDVMAPIEGGRFAGDVTADATVDLDAVPSRTSAPPQVRGRATHRRFVATADVLVTEADGGRWQVEATVRAQGRGWMRPLVAAAGPILAPLLQRRIRSHIAGAAAGFDDTVNALMKDFSAEETADDLVRQLLDNIVSTADGAPP